jgi:hypothetical protein
MKPRAILVVGALVAGCNGDKTGTQPNPPITFDGAAPAPAAPRRTVFHRNPFGDAFQADNLMVDGDFELTGRYDQAPWYAINANQYSQDTLNYGTGGQCRSGIRCGALANPDVLLGYMASPLLENMVVRAYAKVSDDVCDEVKFLTIDVMTGITDKYVDPVSKTPAADGWCVYESQTDNQALQQPALYVTMSTQKKSTAFVDEVSVLPVSEAPVHGITQPPTPVDAATKARVSRVAAWLRAHRRYGERPGKPAGPP